MGTKNNPGAYDCYAKAEPDEPTFTLLARDESGPDVVRLWTDEREHAIRAGLQPDTKHERAKIAEARQCAQQMIAWRNAKQAAQNTAGA